MPAKEALETVYRETDQIELAGGIGKEIELIRSQFASACGCLPQRMRPLTFTIDRGNGGQPQKRAQLTLNRATGEVVRWEPFSNMTLGRRLRSILRFAHTGEVVGIVGQTVAGLVSAGASVIVYTGLALAWRRFRASQARRRDPVKRLKLHHE